MTPGYQTIVWKEFLDTVRDRRSVIPALVTAVIIPVVIFISLLTVAERRDTAVDHDKTVGALLVGADNAPTLVQWLEQKGVAFTRVAGFEEGRDELGDTVRVMLLIPDGYGEAFNAQRPADIGLYLNQKDAQAEKDAFQIQKLIFSYALWVRKARLVAAGAAPPQVNPVKMQVHNIADVEEQAFALSNSFGFLFLIVTFMTAAFFTPDTVAGERERHTLQTLLAQPVTSFEVILGKWTVAGLFAALASAVTVCFGGWLISTAPLADLGVNLFLDLPRLILATFVLVPLAFFAVALQMALASNAKTYREAAGYTSVTVFVPVILLVLSSLGLMESGGVEQYLPISGQHHVLQQLFAEGRFPYIAALGASVTGLVLSALFLSLASRMLSRETLLS